MIALRRVAAAATVAVPKRAFALPMQLMGYADMHEKEKALEAAFFKYDLSNCKVVDKILT